MIQFLLRICLFAIVVAGTSVCAYAEHFQHRGFVSHEGVAVATNEVIVKFRPGTPIAHQASFEAGADLDARETMRHAVRYRSRSRDVASLLTELRGRADVEYAEPNYRVYAQAIPNEPANQFATQWALKNNGIKINGHGGALAGADTSATLAWDLTTGGTATVVAVLDTGIFYTHPDLAANVWSAPADYTVNIGGSAITCAAGTHGFNVQAMTCDPLDDAASSHGTHVSGTIGAVGNNSLGVSGMNWTASIMGVKMLDGGGNGTIVDAINAIEFVVQARHALGINANVRVLSNSWGFGSTASLALKDAIDKADNNEMLFVVAAGNSGTDHDLTASYPSSFRTPNMIVVAATDAADVMWGFSDYGATTVDLAAPGMDIISTLRNNSYGYLTGTSMAAPHVSGVAALMLSLDPELSVASLTSGIVNNTDALASLTGLVITGGRLNAYKAVSSVATPASANFRLDLSTTDQQAVYPQGVASYGLSLSAANGFTGTALLSASGLPAGATAAFAPASLTGSGTSLLSVTADASTPAGVYTLILSATDGVHTHSLTADLTVLAIPDFTLASAIASQTVNQGVTANYTISTTVTNGFAGISTLTLTGLPAGTTASFMPTSITGAGSSTLSVTTTPATPPGTYTLTVTATSGNLVHSTDLTITVTAPDFVLGATSGSQSVMQGTTASYVIVSTALNGFSGVTTLSVSGLPGGAVASFAPTSITGGGSTTLTITTTAATPAGAYTLAVTASSGSLVHTTTLPLTVIAMPDFSFSAIASSQTITVGNSASYTLSTTALNSFTGSVALAVTGLPTGAVANFTPATFTGSGTANLNVTTATTTPPGTYLLTVTATSAALVHSTVLTLTVNPAPGYTLAATPATQTLTSGKSATVTIVESATGGFADTVVLSITGLPPGVTAVFSPASLSAATLSSTLTLTSTTVAKQGTYTLNVSGSSGTISKTATIVLTLKNTQHHSNHWRNFSVNDKRVKAD